MRQLTKKSGITQNPRGNCACCTPKTGNGMSSKYCGKVKKTLTKAAKHAARFESKVELKNQNK